MALSRVLLALVAMLASTMAFVPSTFSKQSTMTMMATKSKALPFLDRPASLGDGSVVGDFGFDPLGLTANIGNYNYVRASELKHCRVAMLAVVGFVFQQYVHILSPESDPLKAITSLGYGPNLQVLSFIGAIELATWDKTYKSSGKPGDLGFDPMGQMKGKSEAQIKDLELKEIKNGRLAMIAFVGMVVQNLLFAKPTLSF